MIHKAQRLAVVLVFPHLFPFLLFIGGLDRALSLGPLMLADMQQVEFWFWTMADEWGRRRRSPCRYTEADALARDPQAQRIDGTREVRLCPDTRREVSALALDTGGFMRESRARMLRDG